VAAAIPRDPFSDGAVPSHSDHICLVDGIDSDPATAPAGYPFKKNSANFAEFYVALCWSPTSSFGLGAEWVGFLIDRRPLLTGGQALVEPLTSSIEGTHASVVVDIAALGNPRSFAWLPFTEIAHQPDPIEAAFYPDVALDNGAFVIWPQ
jgi:hypothetical protein